MLLGKNVSRTIAREYKKERTYTVRVRFEERVLLCFFELRFLIASG